MSLLLRSAARVWTKRPAGPLLIALGILVAGLLATSTDLALQSAELAQEETDRQILGQVMGQIHTPGGYTIPTEELASVQDQVAQARGGPAERYAPLFLERDALVTTGDTTTAAWTVLGLPPATLQALDLPVPGQGQALVDPGDRQLAGQDLQVRIQQAPDEDVRLPDSRQGQLVRTVQVGDQYVHDDGDRYEFSTDVTEGAKRLVLFLSTAGNDTDFDLETVSPSGTTRLDDGGTPAQPEMPRIVVQDPEDGNWTIRVHAKLADNVAFRLEIVQVFDARDAQALGRLLQGQGFRAIGAQLGLTDQARLDLTAQPTDLLVLGPGSTGLVVLPLPAMQQALALGARAPGVLVLAQPGVDVLDGLPAEQAQALERIVEQAQPASSQDRFDPLRGLTYEPEADRREREREARLAATEDLLLVVLPAGVIAGLLLATWAAGLHTRRLQGELQVLAGLGQSRRTSWTLILLHLGPPFLVGLVAALLLAPLVGLAIARGIGLSTTPVLFGSPGALAIPLFAILPVGLTAWLTLHHPIEGQDPRSATQPVRQRTRAIVAGAAIVLTALLVALVTLVDLDPTTGFLLAAGAGATGAIAVPWAPLLEPLLAKASTVRVSHLGLFRTRSSHAYLALAAATTVLVLAALLSGLALSQAATPDTEVEAGGYEVIATTPRFTGSLGELLPEDQQLADKGTELLRQTQGLEPMMLVTGTGIHSADTGGLQTIYGLDSSFAQRHQHLVTPLPGGSGQPFRTVATSEDTAVVSRSVWQALDDDQIFIEGPQGRLSYQVVGVVETRLLEGVYISKDALPVHFNQIAGQQRILLPPSIDADAYAEDLQDVFKDQGLAARSSQAMVDDQLEGQMRAGNTLAAMAALGLATLVLIVVLLGLRARAERRSTDAVFVALGARRRDIAAGIATETLAPLLVGLLLGAIALVPVAGQFDQIQGLAFPLLPIDQSALILATLATVAGVLVLGTLVSALIGFQAVRGLDQKALRELG